MILLGNPGIVYNHLGGDSVAGATALSEDEGNAVGDSVSIGCSCSSLGGILCERVSRVLIVWGLKIWIPVRAAARFIRIWKQEGVTVGF